MKCVIVEPGKPAKESDIENTLAALQNAVGGYIETVHPWGKRFGRCVLVCNEDGKFYENCEPNRLVGLDVIYGTFLILGENRRGDEFTDLTPSQIELFCEKYREPDVIGKDALMWWHGYGTI